MIKALCAAPIGFAAMISTAADAASIIFSGSGTVATSAGRLTPTGAIPIGSRLSFSFQFDPDDAALFEADEQAAFYDLPIVNFQGSIGSYALSVDPDPRFVPVVSIGRGFSFFGGNSSEPSLSFAFYLPRALSAAPDPTAPFVVSSGSRETLSLYATFPSDGSTSLGIDQLKDPQSAALRTFVYSATDPVRRLGGSLQGSFTGKFVSISAVPEPASWAMMLVGFGAIGASMRRRTKMISHANARLTPNRAGGS